MDHNSQPQEPEQEKEQPTDSDELDEASLEDVSGGLITGMDPTNASGSPAALPQLDKQAIKGFNYDLTGKSPV